MMILSEAIVVLTLKTEKTIKMKCLFSSFLEDQKERKTVIDLSNDLAYPSDKELKSKVNKRENLLWSIK